MRTNIEIDDRFMSQALRRSGARTKRAVVEAGLRLLVDTHAQMAIRPLRGKYDGKVIFASPVAAVCLSN
jgi:Arc/MetJ family transcription regulator